MAVYSERGRWSRASANSIETLSRAQTEVPANDLRRGSVNGEVHTYVPGTTATVLHPKFIAIYAQLWIDGQMVADKSLQSLAELNAANLPQDWYIKGKHPDKLKY